MSERVEERGFSCVRITHQRDGAEWNCFAGLAPRGALAPHRIDGALNFSHAVANPPLVGFEFLFARPARPDSAAEPRKLDALAREPRQHVIQLRQLHLQLAFTACGHAAQKYPE